MGELPGPRIDEPLYDAGVAQAIERYWRKAFTFTGRASRSEHWTMWLLGTILMTVTVAGGYNFESTAPGLSNFFGFLFFVCLAALIPGISLAVRRLHDTNRSGWWLLLGFVPFGGLVVLVMLALGPDPAGSRFDAGPGVAAAVAPDRPQATVLAPMQPERGGPPADERWATWWLPGAAGAVVLVAAVILGAVAWSDSMKGASARQAPAVQQASGAAPVQHAVAAATPMADAREAALRAEVEAAPGWQRYSSTLYFKWETGTSACTTAGVGCATVRIETVAAVGCGAGSVELTLLNNGAPVGSSSADFYLLRQGQPATVGVPFDPTLKGDKVRLDRITCG